MDLWKIPKETKTCVVRVVVNPSQPQKYTFSRNKNGNAMLQINIQDPNYDLEYMIQVIRDDLIMKTRYNVQFNFSSTPNSVRENTRFREKITKLLRPSMKKYHPNNLEINALVELVQLHMKNYPQHPDMKKYYLPKQTDKIWNYIKSTANDPNITKEVSVEVAKRILDSEHAENND